MTGETEKITINVNSDAMNAIRKQAKIDGLEASAAIQRAVHEMAIKTGHMPTASADALQAQYAIIDQMIALSNELFSQGKFDDDFVLTVFRAAMRRQEIRDLYEKAIGGNALDTKVPGKTPLNMYLGWYIKNAVGAEPIIDANGKPKRAQVRNEPIQSYTLLQMPS